MENLQCLWRKTDKVSWRTPLLVSWPMPSYQLFTNSNTVYSLGILPKKSVKDIFTVLVHGKEKPSQPCWILGQATFCILIILGQNTSPRSPDGRVKPLAYLPTEPACPHHRPHGCFETLLLSVTKRDSPFQVLTPWMATECTWLGLIRCSQRMKNSQADRTSLSYAKYAKISHTCEVNGRWKTFSQS